MADKKAKNPVGAPRTTSPEKQELIKLGEEMVAWVTKHKPLHLSHWYTQQKMILYKDWKTYIQKPEFLPYYERALSLVGSNCLDGALDKSIAQRFLRIYFKDLKEEEDATAKYNAELKVSEQTSYTQEDIDRAKRILDQVSRNQEALKIANNKPKDADKS